MKCRKCGTDMGVYWTRKKGDSIKRGRRCPSCDARVATVEKAQEEAKEENKKDQIPNM